MNYRINSETKRKIGRHSTNILLYLLVFYTFYMLGKSVWSNYMLQKQITNIQNQIADTQQKNQDFQNLIVYYQSDSFREVQARSKLGLKKPGETVVDVPVKKNIDYNSELESQKQGLVTKEKPETTSNSSLWWRYFTK